MAVLIADPAKARQELDWNPKITFRELVRIMVDADMQVVGLTPIGEGRELLLKSGLNTSGGALFSHTFKGIE